MSDLFITDFIKSKMVQLAVLLGFLLDAVLLETIEHALVLFLLPYCFSVGLNYLMNQSSRKQKARISEQFRARNGGRSRIKITPR